MSKFTNLMSNVGFIGERKKIPHFFFQGGVVNLVERLKKLTIAKKKLLKKNIVPLHANISNTPFDQGSPEPPGEDVLNCHRQSDTQTSG